MIASHETGHAITALGMDVRVIEVTLLPDHDGNAYCLHERTSPYKGLVIDVAGAIAEEIFDRYCPRGGMSSGDVVNANRELATFSGCDKFALDSARRTAESILRREWRAFNAIEQSLRAHRVLDGDDVSALWQEYRTNRKQYFLNIPSNPRRMYQFAI